MLYLSNINHRGIFISLQFESPFFFFCQTYTRNNTVTFCIPHGKRPAQINRHSQAYISRHSWLNRKRKTKLPNDWKTVAKPSRKLSRLLSWCYWSLDVQSNLNSLKELIQMTVKAAKFWALIFLVAWFCIAVFCFHFEQVFCSERIILIQTTCKK